MATILHDFTLEELTQFITANYEVKPFVAKQIFGWLTKNVDFDGMTNVPKNLREALLQDGCIAVSARIIQTKTSMDGTQKFLFQLYDGNIVEGVLMRYKYGNTLCVSTQVGCRMGCKFCASTLGGLIRNLSAGEILGQVLAANALDTDGKSRYVTNIVLMGSGEPLDNFDNVTKFLRLVSSPQGINVSERNISLSTCGLVPQIRNLADMGFSVNLTLSLHNPSTAERKQIMPITNAYSVQEAMDACRYYFNKTGRRVIFEYTLIDGQNDSYSHALKLASLLSGMSAHVNVISLNPVKETYLKGTSERNLQKFLQYLQKLGVSATRRRTMGQDIEGACGQLRRRFISEGNADD
ncbi:MAG: 23S rRNA (adenine(2503)-C(2))-methyltransferase RlmN [Corallococcus sp.]|nr:23S rRNA (adenine(2503)-C(2))-methyltransferase RlmN [Corallococcus sp.]MCM1359150.1 23S rRNA (adenine(2503)-C(2))-methyltransferase RlmN [Corallococcus sp.]MCM1394540.1 23S rRNA (adenine(2503)-C(2))-methyltransferase RlmN [Corallococcus sp.]